MQLHADLSTSVPAERGANYPRSEMVVPCFRIAKHDSKIFRYIVKQYKEGMLLAHILLRAKDLILEGLVVIVKDKMLGMASTVKL